MIDDDPHLNHALCSLIEKRGESAIPFPSADVFLSWFQTSGNQCDLIISDISMPGLSGYDLCRKIRSIPSPDRIPIILVTGTDPGEKAAGIEAGADDFIQKPFESRELLAKVNSLLGIHANEVDKNRTVERFSRFVSPSVAKMLASETLQTGIKAHRADVSILFVDLRGFTAFAERTEPEEVIQVLERYYRVVGDTVLRHQGTLGHLAGDGIMAFFNDPEPVMNHPEVAIDAALSIRDALALERKLWKEKNHELDFGIGIAEGETTIGGIGFDHFWQYSVIGPVTNFASRLCQTANSGEIRVSQNFLEKVHRHCQTRSLGKIQFKGIEEPISVFNIISLS